jgi:hypothetical protein
MSAGLTIVAIVTRREGCVGRRVIRERKGAAGGGEVYRFAYSNLPQPLPEAKRFGWWDNACGDGRNPKCLQGETGRKCLEGAFGGLAEAGGEGARKESRWLVSLTPDIPQNIPPAGHATAEKNKRWDRAPPGVDYRGKVRRGECMPFAARLAAGYLSHHRKDLKNELSHVTVVGHFLHGRLKSGFSGPNALY